MYNYNNWLLFVKYFPNKIRYILIKYLSLGLSKLIKLNYLELFIILNIFNIKMLFYFKFINIFR